MIAVAQEDKQGRWPTAWLRWFGRHSYEVYLTHMFVVLGAVEIFLALGSSTAWIPAWYLAVLATSGLLGALLARWYSEPLNRKLRQTMRPAMLQDR